MDGVQKPQSPTGAPPPLPPQPRWGDSVQALFNWNQRNGREQQAEHDLSSAQEQLQAMQTLLEELPEIFERKFQARLRPILEQQQQLLHDNAALRQQLLQLQPAQDSSGKPLLLPAREQQVGLRSSLHKMLPWRRPSRPRTDDLAA